MNHSTGPHVFRAAVLSNNSIHVFGTCRAAPYPLKMALPAPHRLNQPLSGSGPLANQLRSHRPGALTRTAWPGQKSCFNGSPDRPVFKSRCDFFPDCSEAPFDGTAEDIPKMGSYFERTGKGLSRCDGRRNFSQG